MREFARILRPDGLAAIWWNSRRLSGTPFLEGYEALLLEYGTDYVSVAERYADDARMHAWFGAGFRGSAWFDHVQKLDFDALRGRLMSSSYAPQAGHPQHEPMLRALRELFDRCATQGTISFEYDTRIFAGAARLTMYDILRPLLFRLDAETAHRLTLYGLGVAQRSGFAHRSPRRRRTCRSPSSASPSRIRSAWPPGWTRMPSIWMRSMRWASASSRWVRSRRCRSRATTSRACSGCRDTRRSSTGSASTTAASMRWCATCSSPATTACSASISARTRTRRTRRRSTIT